MGHIPLPPTAEHPRASNVPSRRPPRPHRAAPPRAAGKRHQRRPEAPGLGTRSSGFPRKLRHGLTPMCTEPKPLPLVGRRPPASPPPWAPVAKAVLGTRGKDQKPPASTVSPAQPAAGGGAGAGFDIFTSTSCFLLSSHPALGNGSSFSPCFSSRISAGCGLCATSPGGRRRAGTSSRSDGSTRGGHGGKRGSRRWEDFSRSLVKDKSPAPGVTGKCKPPRSGCCSQKDTCGASMGTDGRLTATPGGVASWGGPLRAPQLSSAPSAPQPPSAPAGH